jgi:hypothetical protein
MKSVVEDVLQYKEIDYTSFCLAHLKFREPGFALKSPSWPPMTYKSPSTTTHALQDHTHHMNELRYIHFVKLWSVELQKKSLC